MFSYYCVDVDQSKQSKCHDCVVQCDAISSQLNFKFVTVIKGDSF